MKVVGVDLGGTFIKSGLVDDQGNIVKRSSVPTEASRDKETVISNIVKAIQNVISDDVVAVGLGSPGLVDSSRGIIVSGIENIPSLNGVHIAEEIKSRLELPVFADNDANNAARGELLFGAAKGKRNFICITLGTGIGGGIVVNRDIYGGTINYAGEIGHLVLIPDGRKCTCGKFGCWEAYGSATAMIEEVKSAIKRGIPSSLEEFYPDGLNAKVVVEAALNGDELAVHVVKDAGKYVGIGVASLINIFNPEMVVIGGGVSLAGEILFSEIRYYAMLNSMSRSWSSVEIVPAKLGNDAGVLGSAGLAFMKMSER